ncbi:MAG: cupin domain-containing protein [Candidatus Kariarchaeaceae archaeon]|jgi:quercetin dioxygenase-like cupin family protein
MVQSGERIEVDDNEWIEFIQTSQDTDGELLEIRVSYPPNSEKPPNHNHPYQAEEFEVVQGTFRTVIGGQEAVYQQGEKFEVEIGVNHIMHNIAEKRGELLWKVKPALATEELFEELWSLNRDAREQNSKPSLLQIAPVMQRHNREFRLAVPNFVQKILFGVLGSLGRLRGY